MKYIIVLLLCGLLTGCTSIKKEEVKETDYLSVGMELMESESIGKLKLGLTKSEILNILGEPSENSVPETWGADGLRHEAWVYSEEGIRLDILTDEDKLNSIFVENPFKEKTSRKIGINSTREEVLKAYENEVNKEENSDENKIIVGTEYGGIVFNIEDNKVSWIYIGASAE